MHFNQIWKQIKMKPLRKTVLALTLLSLAACQNLETNQQEQSQGESKKTYGSAKAVVDEEPIPAESISGPVAYAPNVPVLSNNQTVDVRIDVQHKKITVAEGVSFWAWTFGDSIPGPVLRVKVGQTIHFKMANRSKETAQYSPPMPHSIDLHAAMVNPSDKYQSIPPGSTISFSWTANYPGVFMYHCGTPIILQHMIYGMIGMTIVEPKEGFPGKVDREYAIIQNEFYLKQKSDGSYMVDLDAARKKQPLYVTFNGKPGQYVQNPLKAKAGERIRLYVCNAGPNDESSFHVVGTLFDKVWLDGNPVNQLRGMQTVLLGASSGAIVEFVIPEAGTYTFLDHEFADVEAGAVGLIIAE